MYDLVYCSEGVSELTQQDVIDILNTARDFNDKHNITGCLLFYNNQFLQIIEGNKEDITDLYNNIKKDKRHSSILLLSTGEKEERSFPNWSMAFKELNENDLNHIIDQNVMANFSALADFAKKDSESLHFFWSMAKQIIED